MKKAEQTIINEFSLVTGLDELISDMDSPSIKRVTDTLKKHAIEFAQWMNDKRYSLYWGSDAPNCGKWYIQYTTPTREYFTTSELYEKFNNEIK